MKPESQGRCLCGGIRYVVRGELREVVDCHCSRCRQFTGHYLAATRAPVANLDVADPEGLLQWFYPVPEAGYAFCSRCGASMFWQAADDPDYRSICAGTLEPPTGLTTTVALWVSEASDYHQRPSLEELDRE